MEITLYSNIDPRRFLPGAYKSMNDIVPLLGGTGEPMKIDSQTKSNFDGAIPVMRDLTLTGKFEMSIIMHGNTNLVLDHAEITNAQGANATITLASDFTGTVSIADSKVNFNNPTGLWGIWTDIEQDSQARMQSFSIINSSIEGVVANPEQLILDGNVEINSKSAQARSVFNAANVDAQNAIVTAKYLQLFNANTNAMVLHQIILKQGPIEFNGKWNIDEAVIDSNNSHELFQFNGKYVNTIIKIKRLTVKKAPRGISLFYSDNVIFKFDNSFLGDPKNKYNAAIKDSVLEFKETTDHLHWLLTGKNGVSLDKVTISELRGRASEFVSLDLAKLNQNENQAKAPTTDTNSSQMPAKENNDLNDLSINSQKENTQNNESGSAQNSANSSTVGMPTQNGISDADKQDIKVSESTKKNATHADGMSKLNSLIGLKEVKQTIASFIAVAVMNKKREARGLKTAKGITMHMVLAGAPGTGKTTVAKDIGQILYEQGVLEKPTFNEYTAKDLVSDHVGATQQKTHNAIEKSIGGVLFIDEAYSLASKGNSFADEAIAELLTGMEKYRDNTVVILAGYQDEMHHFIYESNPGFLSRIGQWVKFPDYSPKELIQIFKLICKNMGVVMNPQFINTKMFKYCLNHYQGYVTSKKTGKRIRSNARGVRDMIDALVRVRDSRLMHVRDQDALTNQQLSEVTARDIKTLFLQVRQDEKENKQLATEIAKDSKTKSGIIGNDK